MFRVMKLFKCCSQLILLAYIYKQHFCQVQVNSIKMFISFVIAIAFASIVPINGNPTFEQKVNALERRLDEHNKRLSIVEHERTSLCSKYYATHTCISSYSFYETWNLKVPTSHFFNFFLLDKKKCNRWANPSWLGTNNALTDTNFRQKLLRLRCHDFSALAN